MDALAAVIKSLPIRSLIIMSRVNHVCHLLTHEKLKTISDKKFVKTFMAVDSTVWKGYLDPRITNHYLSPTFIGPCILKFPDHEIAIYNNRLIFDVIIVCKKDKPLYLQSLLNVPNIIINNNSIQLLHQVNMKSNFNIKNKYSISSRLLYQYIKHYFPDGTVIQVENVNQLTDINQILNYCDNNELKAKIKIRHDGCIFHLIVNKNKIYCSIKSRSYSLTRINYEHIINMLYDILYHNNMIKYYKLNDITQLKTSVQHYRSSSFIKCHLGGYMSAILKNKQDLYFDHLITDPRVKLNKYKILVKDQLIYRCWLLKQWCIIDYDNLIDIIHYYQLIY